MSEESQAVQSTNNTAQDSEVIKQDAEASVQSQAAPAETVSNNEASVKPEGEVQELTLVEPEGNLLSQEQLAEIKAYAKDKGLSQEMAQDMVNKNNEALIAYKSSIESSFEEKRSEWANQVMQDKEIGGPDFNRNVEYAKRALEKFSSKELRDALETTGLGNHPELVRTFYRIGKAMAEDSFVKSGPTQTSNKSMEEIFYGSNNNN